jgi:hypothetical protein
MENIHEESQKGGVDISNKLRQLATFENVRFGVVTLGLGEQLVKSGYELTEQETEDQNGKNNNLSRPRI